MHFSARHVFPGPLEGVGAALGDPDLYTRLQLPDLDLPELIEVADDGAGRLLRLRYRYTGSLHPIVRRLLGGDGLTWLQDVRVEPARRYGTVHFAAEKDPRRLHGDATFTLVAEAAKTVRDLEGDLVVDVPGLGPMAERRLVPGILGRLDAEAAAISARLSS